MLFNTRADIHTYIHMHVNIFVSSGNVKITQTHLQHIRLKRWWRSSDVFPIPTVFISVLESGKPLFNGKCKCSDRCFASCLLCLLYVCVNAWIYESIHIFRQLFTTKLSEWFSCCLLDLLVVDCGMWHAPRWCQVHFVVFREFVNSTALYFYFLIA